MSPHTSMFALLGGGVRVRVWIREQRKIKRRSKAYEPRPEWKFNGLNLEM